MRVYIYTVESYSTIEKNEIRAFPATWMDLETIILSEVSQTEKDRYMYMYLYVYIYVYICIYIVYDITTERLHFHFICDIIKR